jgi:hypothetical protein
MFLPHRSCDRPQRPPHHSLTWDREIAAAFSELPQRTRPTSTLDRGAASPNSPAQPQDPLTPLSTLIPLVGGLLTWVDADDARMVAGWTWSALRRKDGRGWYAVRWETAGGQRRSIYLHRQLLAAPPGSDVVHVNGDGLDNRRTNLRLCTRSQSAASRRTCSPQTGYCGVYRDGRSFSSTDDGRWQAPFTRPVRDCRCCGGRIRPSGTGDLRLVRSFELSRGAAMSFCDRRNRCESRSPWRPVTSYDGALRACEQGHLLRFA